MSTYIYTDNWIRNDFIDKHKDIIIEIDNVVKIKNTLGEAFWVTTSNIKLDIS